MSEPKSFVLTQGLCTALRDAPYSPTMDQLLHIWREMHRAATYEPQQLPSQPAERDDRRAEVADRLRKTTEAMAHSAVVDMDIWDRHSNACLNAADEIDTLTADRDRLKARVEELEKALEPFADEWADENGWLDGACQNERIVDWFGPSDFRAARQALKGEHA